MSNASAQSLSRWPHRWAWLLACATFPLVWWGGFVTASGSGMAFRDWLTSDGVFMPLYPWLSSTGAKFIEHGHRLLGMLAGLLTIALVASLWLAEPRRWVRWFGVALLAGVVLQGVLGGMRVVLDERMLALVHGCVGPLFFAACAAMVVVTSPLHSPAILAGGPQRKNADDARRARSPQATRRGEMARQYRLAALTSILVYLQLVVGAIVRHSPLMLTESAGAIFQAAVYFHMLLAVAVSAHVLVLAHRAFWSSVARGTGITLALLILAQLLLGAGTWLVKYGMPGWAVAALGEWPYRNTESGAVQAVVIAGHGAVGALLVALCVAVAVAIRWHIGLDFPQRRPAAAPIAGAPA